MIASGIEQTLVKEEEQNENFCFLFKILLLLLFAVSYRYLDTFLTGHDQHRWVCAFSENIKCNYCHTLQIFLTAKRLYFGKTTSRQTNPTRTCRVSETRYIRKTCCIHYTYLDNCYTFYLLNPLRSKNFSVMNNSDSNRFSYLFSRTLLTMKQKK